MHHRVEIRPACSQDAELVAELYRTSKLASLPELVTPNDLDLDWLRNRWSDYLTYGSRAQGAKGDGYVFIAEVGGTTAGYAAWHRTTRYGADAELQSIYVLRERQNAGTGGALLLRVVEHALSLVAQSMCVGYDPQNPYKRFYAKHGAIELNEHWSLWRDLRQSLNARDF